MGDRKNSASAVKKWNLATNYQTILGVNMQLMAHKLNKGGKSIGLVAVLLLSSGCATVSKEELEVLSLNSSGAYFEEVVPVEGMKASELYDTAMIWMARNYNSANDVIQLQDKGNHRILGKGIFPIPFMMITTDVRHTILFEARDGRYRLRYDSLYVSPDGGSDWELSNATSTQLQIVRNTEKAIADASAGLKELMHEPSSRDDW